MNKLYNWINALKSQRAVISVVRALRLSTFMKNLYFWIFAPKYSLKTLQLEGFEAQFRVNNYTELHALDTVFSTDGKAEDEVIRTMFQVIGRGDTVYDIGANMGVHSIFMALRVRDGGKVIAFEPENSMYKALKENILVNKVSNVMPLNIALGEKNERRYLYGKKQVGTGAFSLVGDKGSTPSQRVDVFEGDYIVKRDGLSLPRAVKIDVEGYEYFVLLGLRETLSSDVCRFVFCEIHPKLLDSEIGPDRIRELLRSMGFGNIQSRMRGDEIHAFFYKDKPVTSA